MFHSNTLRKVATYVSTAAVGIQAIFFSSYDVQGFEHREHIFSNAQSKMRDWIDGTIYGIDDAKSEPAEKESARRRRS